MASFRDIPGLEPPDAPLWVDHVLRWCVVATFLGYFAFIFRWIDSATWWGPWLPALPGVLGPLVVLPWWWPPERRPADALRLIVAGLIPAMFPAFALLSLPIALAGLLIVGLVVLAPRLATEGMRSVGAPSGRIRLWTHSRYLRKSAATSRARRRARGKQ
ncbi:MAG: hypothetical protein IPI13_02455 [Actinomycetales bacterium]|uniref:Uncharacterized protein n=1 Tax=Candidatus Phosphoribacter hodrii TaxID=2953743 RepID=A0A935M8U1_9MICO|nr:hypothetical protein [Candidatus Phosphoribacter hodrii]MBP8838099.1 hypothetical protein [Dermatophilaceae bacterium]OPZ55172.1 MAG: hypothetical protein BWY91_01215 [bacterium ADurb.BinA028]MBK7272053.1 hypothetical protein [Candidatus Phosphoribacter hodrii]HNV14374.1 hypothetical protein [Dermatophilaceae bacterium]